jgi:hypothetical protein
LAYLETRNSARFIPCLKTWAFWLTLCNGDLRSPSYSFCSETILQCNDQMSQNVEYAKSGIFRCWKFVLNSAILQVLLETDLVRFEMSSASKGFAVAVSIFSFFCLMSRLDFIVHGILYRYGLQFSYEWANEYWATYAFAFIFFSVVMGLMYWLGSNKTSTDAKISLGLFATINILMVGGLQDLMFYVFWEKGLPPDSVTWWWSPLSHIFGTWNSSMQITLTVLACLITVPLWTYIVRKPDLSKTGAIAHVDLIDRDVRT